MPLTHYERTKKFASSEYGTTKARLAGHSQYQVGDCALSLTQLSGNTALCSPSGYLYSQDAILEYLLTKTQELKECTAVYERQQQDASAKQQEAAEKDRKRSIEDFEDAQKVVSKRQRPDDVKDSRQIAREGLKATSYWLADSQPQHVEQLMKERPPERPPSPTTQTPALRRKDLWPVALKRKEGSESGSLVCAVTGKPIRSASAIAYWTDKKEAGTIVLQSVYDDLIVKGSGDDKQTPRCPETSKRIKYTRKLQTSGTSFASSSQQVQVKKYTPTIT